MNLFLFLSLVFILTVLLGTLIRKKHIPWIFAALIIGFGIAIFDTFVSFNPFETVYDSHIFSFLAELGMYFLLFVIGFELDLKEMKKNGKFIFVASMLITFFSGIFGTLLLFFVFNQSFFISLVIGLSFSTVGEAILIPILDEFKIVNEPLGQAIIGIGTLDDIIEVLALVLVILSIGSGTGGSLQVVIILFSLVGVFLLTILLVTMKKTGKRFKLMNIETLFFFVIGILFLFIGIGLYSEAAALGALLGGIALKNFIPAERLEKIESEVKTMCFGFFGPIFFLWVGLMMDITYLITFPILILLVVLVSGASKIFASYLVGRKKFGRRDSIILGVGLSVRFSTSIVLITILYNNNLIDSGLYSIIIASSMIFTFIIPLIFCRVLEHRTMFNGNKKEKMKKMRF